MSLFGNVEIISKETFIDDNPDLYVERAQNELKSGNYNVALSELTDAIRYSNMGNNYIQQKIDIYKVIPDIDRYSENIVLDLYSFEKHCPSQFNTLIQLYMNRASDKKDAFEYLLDRGINVSAVKQIDFFNGKTPKDYYYDTALSFLSKNLLDEAIANAQTAVKIGVVKGYEILFDCYIQQEKFAEALNTCQDLNNKNKNDITKQLLIRLYNHLYAIFEGFNRKVEAGEVAYIIKNMGKAVLLTRCIAIARKMDILKSLKSPELPVRTLYTYCLPEVYHKILSPETKSDYETLHNLCDIGLSATEVILHEQEDIFTQEDYYEDFIRCKLGRV